MSKVVGIDLGTTNSLVAYVKDGVPRGHSRSQRRRPGAVRRLGRRSRARSFVGREAQRRLLTDAQRTVYSVKRFMGKGPDDVRDESSHFPFRIGGEGGVLRIGVGDKEFTPPEISAFVLRELKSRAEAFFAEQGEFDNEVDRAVITVPAYFNDAQRTATRDAGRHRRPRGAAHHQRADRRLAGLRPRQAARRRRSRSTTSAAARSTSRSCASRTASSRCSPPTATRTSAATTSTTC